MVIGKSLLWSARVAGALIATSALVGCGIQPGDYEIYRVSFGELDQSAGCYWGETEHQPPNDKASDSTTVRESGTWILYASIEDKLYLDTGKVTLEGATSDEGYTFTGKTVNIWFGADVDDNDLEDTDPKVTATTVTTLNIITDGNAISGRAVTKTSFKCSGTKCAAEPVPSCTETSPFVGTYVEDIELKHDI
jgi:hypothetical protein